MDKPTRTGRLLDIVAAETKKSFRLNLHDGDGDFAVDIRPGVPGAAILYPFLEITPLEIFERGTLDYRHDEIYVCINGVLNVPTSIRRRMWCEAGELQRGDVLVGEPAMLVIDPPRQQVGSDDFCVGITPFSGSHMRRVNDVIVYRTVNDDDGYWVERPSAGTASYRGRNGRWKGR